MGGKGLVAVAKIEVSGFRDEPAYEIQIEPWGEMFTVAPGSRLQVTFLGSSGLRAPAETGMSRAAWGVSLWALAGCSDYLVTDESGAVIVGH